MKDIRAAVNRCRYGEAGGLASQLYLARYRPDDHCRIASDHYIPLAEYTRTQAILEDEFAC